MICQESGIDESQNGQARMSDVSTIKDLVRKNLREEAENLSSQSSTSKSKEVYFR
jgi:hypothetical protein